MKVNVFLDRDGTLIEDVGYIASSNDVRPLPGVFEGLQLFKRNHYRLHVISNQSGLARGKFTREEFEEVQARFIKIFSERDIVFDTLNYCFHLPTEECSCRKPKPGLFEKVNSENQIDKLLSAMIGNSDADRGAAEAFGIPYWDVRTLVEDDLAKDTFEVLSSHVVEYFNGVQHELE